MPRQEILKILLIKGAAGFELENKEKREGTI